jgi:hypothetical protein
VIRVFATLVAVAAALAGSVGAFAAMQAVGPPDRTNEFGFGDAATESPGGGTLLETRNFRLVVAALERELGADGRLETLDLQPTGATASARRGDRRLFVEVDASGRSSAREVDDDDSPRALVPVTRLEAAAIDRIRRAVQKETNAPIARIMLIGGTREWNVSMASGEPDAFTANLDGRGVRLPGEPNPAPVGAHPDSLLRAENLERVLQAARREAGDDAQVTGLDIRPDRVGFEIQTGGRTLALQYGYDAQLTGRDVRAQTGVPTEGVRLSAIDPGVVERMARATRRTLRTHGLVDVQYVLLNASGLTGPGPHLLMYLPSGSDPPYVVTDLRGRGLTWPGRS